MELEYNSENDLFWDLDLLPIEVKVIIEKYQLIDTDTGLNYSDLANMLKELEILGYTFEYGLDAIPFNLQKINN
jgi:hypothetical protein